MSKLLYLLIIILGSIGIYLIITRTTKKIIVENDENSPANKSGADAINAAQKITGM